MKIVNFLLNIYALIMARPWLERFHQMVVMLGMRGLGVFNAQNDRLSGEDHLIRKVYPTLIRNREPVVVDVGANVGHYSLSIRNRFPGAKIYAFEPNPPTYAKLATLACEGVKMFNYAVGETNGSLLLYDLAEGDGSELASLYPEVIRDFNNMKVKSTKVDVITLDDFAREEKVDFIDILKIDTEGHEYAVLKGAARLLAEKRVGCIHFEFNAMNVVSHTFLRDFRLLLKGYSFYRLLPSSLLPLSEKPFFTEVFGYQNILAVPAGREPENR